MPEEKKYIFNRDLNHVKCACDNPECVIGIRYDTDSDYNNFLLIQDKKGKDTSMVVTEESTKELIKYLKECVLPSIIERNKIKAYKNKILNKIQAK